MNRNSKYNVRVALLLIFVYFVPGSRTGTSGLQKIDLDGVWLDGSREVTISQVGRTVLAYYKQPYECDPRNGSSRQTTTKDFTGTLNRDQATDGAQLTGQITVCSWGSGNNCGNGINQASLKLTVKQNGLILEGDYYNCNEQKNKPVLLTRCGSGQKGLCSSIDAARSTIKQILVQDLHTPTDGEWKGILDRERPRLKSDLMLIRSYFCQDKDQWKKIDEMIHALESLDSGNDTTLAQRQRVAAIDVDLESVGQTECSSPPQNSGDPCKEFSNAALDGLKEYFEKLDKLKEGDQQDNDAYKLVKKGIEDGIKLLKEEADRANEGRSTAKDLKQHLDEINSKISKLKELLGYWDQIKAASCLPPEVEQLLRRLAMENRSGTEHQATCTELCAKTADWIIRLTGDSRQREGLFATCFAECR